MLKYALKNITSKPLRTVGIVLTIAIVVAMVFCMLSFKSAVYEFIYASETSSKGSSDILISTKSNTSRIVNISNELKNVDGIKEIIPSLTIYALFNDEYVQLRGYEKENIETIQTIKYLSKESLEFNSDSIVISKTCADRYNLSIGNKLDFKLGNYKASFYVWGISENSGYFLSDSPYQFIGTIDQISKLVIGTSSDLYNEIYIKVNDGIDANAVIIDIKSISAYSDLKVEHSKDEGTIKEKTASLTAPVVLSGAAVLALGIVFIVILFMMSAQEKISQIARYTIVGATKKQIFTMFLIESAIYALIGAIVGSLLAVGLFVGILKLTLSSLIVFSVDPLKLFGAAAIGFITSIVSSLIPMFKAFKGTVRENQLNLDKKSLAKILFPIASTILLIISIIIEFTVPSVKAIFAIITIALALLTIGLVVGLILQGVGKLISRASNPAIKYAGIGVDREKRFSKSITLMTVGMTVAMMLFMAWSLTTTIFNGYIDNFSNMIFVSNVKSDVNVEDFKNVASVDNATRMVWTEAELSDANFNKTINVLGSKDVLDMVEFKYISDESTVKSLVSSNQPYVLVDIAMNELYSVNVGDVLQLDIDGVKNDVIVGGILQHELFSGNYLIISSDNLITYFDKAVDTVLVTTEKDIDDCVGELRAAFASKNYYVVKVLDAYRWDKESMEAVFSLIGTLAIVVALFIFVVTVASSLIGRSTAEKERVAMLSSGMSKSTLLTMETYQHILISLISFAISFAISILLTASLIHALRLFGLYFNFMYEAWVVAASGGAMAILYAIVPVVLNYKKYYNIKKL